ncbi:pentapeptide repeat-containing protein [Gelidibacter mesophilus]|uniref:pentapeptide repeat-containing protein n=1 Tax=Gelidibacter mesophilus TaxID=169050 RepID=UPI0003FED2E2|nr:pentapeptide repeat-containing protein [Gelidibacter mesophilus]
MTNEIITHENKEFKNVDYSGKTLRNREFFKCKFISCIFVKSDLRGNSFEECTFQDCNFSMTEIEGTGFRNASFIGSKILGIDFTRCNNFAFSFRFENCIMDYCTFFGTKLKNTHFVKCSLKEADFTESDLSSAVFNDTDLTGTRFLNTILEKAEFRNAKNFAIDPEFNKLKKAKFSAFQLEGLLYKYQLIIS